MALRDSLSWQLRLAPRGRFLRASMFDGRRNRFMRGRGEPYEGWRDRMSGSYVMKHNRHDNMGPDSPWEFQNMRLVKDR